MTLLGEVVGQGRFVGVPDTTVVLELYQLIGAVLSLAVMPSGREVEKWKKSDRRLRRSMRFALSCLYQAAMLRLTLGQVSHRLAPHAVRGFAAAAPLQNKASRSGRKVKWTLQSAPRATPVAGTPTPGQAGTDVGQGGTGLFEGEAPPAAAAAESSVPTPEQIEKEMLDAQPELQATEQTQDRPNLAGTDVAQGGAPEANSQAQAEQQAKSENYG